MPRNVKLFEFAFVFVGLMAGGRRRQMFRKNRWLGGKEEPTLRVELLCLGIRERDGLIELYLYYRGSSDDISMFLHKMTFFGALVLSAARRRPLDGVVVHALVTTPTPVIQSSKHQRLSSFSYRRSASSYRTTTTRRRNGTSLDSSSSTHHDDVTSTSIITTETARLNKKKKEKALKSGREKRKKFIGLAKAVDRGQFQYVYSPGGTDGTNFSAKSGLPDTSKPFCVLGIESSCDDTGGKLVSLFVMYSCSVKLYRLFAFPILY